VQAAAASSKLAAAAIASVLGMLVSRTDASQIGNAPLRTVFRSNRIDINATPIGG
jgi:hypothetical protein